MTRILLGFVLVFGFSGLVAADAVEDKYNKTCVVCHAAGAAGAPKTGVPAEWTDRMAKGMDVMVQSVEKGLNAMPPFGAALTPEQIHDISTYVVEELPH